MVSADRSRSSRSKDAAASPSGQIDLAPLSLSLALCGAASQNLSFVSQVAKSHRTVLSWVGRKIVTGRSGGDGHRA